MGGHFQDAVLPHKVVEEKVVFGVEIDAEGDRGGDRAEEEKEKKPETAVCVLVVQKEEPCDQTQDTEGEVTVEGGRQHLGAHSETSALLVLADDRLRPQDPDQVPDVHKSVDQEVDGRGLQLRILQLHRSAKSIVEDSWKTTHY